MNDDDVACRGARFDECGGDERLHPISTITKAVGSSMILGPGLLGKATYLI